MKCEHEWVQSWAHLDHDHGHYECLKCGTRMVQMRAGSKVSYDVKWAERRGEPDHPTAGDPIIQRGRA